MERAELIPLEELAQLEADQLRQSLKFIVQIKNVIAEKQSDDDLRDFELNWLDIGKEE